MVGAVEDVEEAELDEPQRRLMPARIEPHEPGIAVELEGAHGAARRQEAQHRHRRGGRAARAAGGSRTRDRSDWIGYSNSTSSSPWLQKTRCRPAAAAPVTCAERLRRTSANDLSDGSDGAHGDDPRLPSAAVVFVELEVVGQPERRRVAQRGVGAAEIAGRLGAAHRDSRCRACASSGARTSSWRRWPSGFRKAWTVTSFGMSCADERGGPGEQRASSGATQAQARDGARRPESRSCSASTLSAEPVVTAPRWRMSAMKRTNVSFDRHGVAGAARRRSASAQHRARAARGRAGQGRRAGAAVRSRSVVAEAAAQSLGARLTIGVGVDSRITSGSSIAARRRSSRRKSARPPTRPPPSAALPAPPVLEFDPAGNLVSRWGGPGQGYEWPESNHGITVDTRATCGSAATAQRRRTS